MIQITDTWWKYTDRGSVNEDATEVHRYLWTNEVGLPVSWLVDWVTDGVVVKFAVVDFARVVGAWVVTVCAVMEGVSVVVMVVVWAVEGFPVVCACVVTVCVAERFPVVCAWVTWQNKCLSNCWYSGFGFDKNYIFHSLGVVFNMK